MSCDSKPMLDEEVSETTPQPGGNSKGTSLRSYSCVDCGSPVTKRGVTCVECAIKRRKANKPAEPNPTCVDCGKPISRGALRCKKHGVLHSRKKRLKEGRKI